MRSFFVRTLLVAVALLGLAPQQAKAQSTYSFIQSSGTTLARRRAINCTGGLNCTDDATGFRTKMDVGSAGAGGLQIKAMATPGAPTVTNVGAAGSTSYTYYFVATDKAGNKTLPSLAGSTSTGNASLSSTNYNHLAWSAVPGAVSYDVLSSDTGHSVALAVTGTTYNDQTGSLSVYTAPTRNGSADLSIDGVLVVKTGAALASASTITPTNRIHHVTGTTAINTITAPAACMASGYGCTIILIPDGLWSTTTSGNIALATTAVVSKALHLTYDPAVTKWFPTY